MLGTTELSWRFGTIEVPAADKYIRPALELTGEFSGAEIDLYQSLLRPGDVAVDVGANIGVFTAAMGLSVGPTGRVLAFEPQPPIFEILQRNVARLGLENVDARRAIVAEAPGQGEFAQVERVPENVVLNFGAFSVASRATSEYGSMAATEICSIDGIALDRCDFVKIDAEGSEAVVLSGLQRTVARCRPILSIECDRPNAQLPWVDDFLGAGYRLWLFLGKNLREPNPKSASIEGLQNYMVVMVLAVPPERPDQVAGMERSGFQEIKSRLSLELFSRKLKVAG